MHVAIGLVFVMLWAAPLTGQVMGTQCWTTPNGMTQCNSQPGVMYNPNANAFADAMTSLRNSLAQMAYMRQMRAQAEQRARMQEEQRTAQEQRQQAALELYRDRAWAVVKHLADSLMLSGAVGQQFIDSVGPTLVNLYLVSPAASREEIAAALWPRTQAISEQFTAFITRVAPPMKPAIDSLPLSTDQRATFIQALFVQLQQTFMVVPNAGPDSVRVLIQPLFDHARAFIQTRDSVARDSAARAAQPAKPRPSRPARSR